MPDNKLQQDPVVRLYDNIKNDYDLPDFNTFKADMLDSAKANKLHSALVKDGYEMPSFDVFSVDMGLKKKGSTTSRSLDAQSQLPLQKTKSLVPSAEPFLGNTLQEAVAKDKTPKTNWAAAKYNDLVGVLSSTLGGLASLQEKRYNVGLEKAMELSGETEQRKAMMREKAFIKGSGEKIKESVEKLRSRASDKEYEEKINKIDISDGVQMSDLGGVLNSAPAQIVNMVATAATYGTNNYLQSVDNAISEIEKSPNADKFSESDKLLYANTQGLVQAALEYLPIGAMLSKTGLGSTVKNAITKTVLNNFVKKGVKATAKELEEAVTKEVSSFSKKAMRVGYNAAFGILAESPTEVLQQGASDGIKLAANAIKNNEIFDESDIRKNFWKNVGNAAVAGGAFGGAFGGGAGLMKNTNKAIRKEIAKAENQQDLQKIQNDLNYQVELGNLTQEEAKAAGITAQQYAEIASKIPAEIPKDKKYAIIGGIEQREKLKQDIELVKADEKSIDDAFPEYKQGKKDEIALLEGKLGQVNDYIQSTVSGYEPKYTEKDGKFYVTRTYQNGNREGREEITKQHYEAGKLVEIGKKQNEVTYEGQKWSIKEDLGDTVIIAKPNGSEIQVNKSELENINKETKIQQPTEAKIPTEEGSIGVGGDVFEQKDRYVVNKDKNNFSFYHKLEKDNTKIDSDAVKEFPQTKVPFKLYRTDDFNNSKSDISDGNRPNGSKGVYFSLNKEYSNMYGKSGAKGFYLDLKNPKVITSDFSEFDFQNLTEKDVQKLKEQGYDGIIVHTPKTTVKIEGDSINGEQELYSEVIAFDKKQIKAVEQSLKEQPKQQTKIETPSVKEEGSVGVGGDVVEGETKVVNGRELTFYNIKGRNDGSGFAVEKGSDGYVIHSAMIPMGIQRQGIGTRFYVRMNEESVKNTGNPLRSSDRLSNSAGKPFWENLVKNGYAEKTGDGYIFKSQQTLTEKQKLDKEKLASLTGKKMTDAEFLDYEKRVADRIKSNQQKQFTYREIEDIAKKVKGGTVAGAKAESGGGYTTIFFHKYTDADAAISKLRKEGYNVSDRQNNPANAYTKFKITVEKAVEQSLKETPKAEVKVEEVDKAKKEYVSQNGKHKIVYDEKGNYKVINVKTGEEVSKPTAKKIINEAADNYDFSKGKRAEFEEGLQLKDEKEADEYTLENTNNPIEVVEVYARQKPEGQPLSTVEQMIAEMGIGKITPESFKKYGDKNNIDSSIVFAYFKGKRGQKALPIDVVAKEMSDHYGVEIEPQDIVDFMVRFPKGEYSALKESENSVAVSAREKFEKLTGLPLTQEVAIKAIDYEFNKLAKEQQQLAEQQFRDEKELTDAYWNEQKGIVNVGEKGDNIKVEPPVKKRVGEKEAYKDLTRNEKRQIINSKFDELLKELKIEKICPT